jgi:hypothetical protein
MSGLIEVEGGEVLKVVPHELDLGRGGGRAHVGLEGHSLRDWRGYATMLACGWFSLCLYILVRCQAEIELA